MLFEDILTALIYFVKDKSTSIYPVTDIPGWKVSAFDDLTNGKKIYLEVEYEGEKEKVVVLQLSSQSWDDIPDGELHELTDTRNFVHQMKGLKIHLDEIRQYIKPLKPIGRQKFPSLSVSAPSIVPTYVESISSDRTLVKLNFLHLLLRFQPTYNVLYVPFYNFNS